MKKFLLYLAVMLFFLCMNANAQWQYGQHPFSMQAPYLSTLGTAVDNKVPSTYMYNSLHFPYPTNAWFMNSILKQGTFPNFNYVPGRQDEFSEKIFPYPYLVKAYQSGPVTNTKMMGFGYTTPDFQFQINHWSPGDTVNSVGWLPDVYFFFGTQDSASINKGSLASFDDLTATYKWSDGAGSMTCPVARGMPYFTMMYNNLRPMMFTPNPGLQFVNGQPLFGNTRTITGTKFKLSFGGTTGSNNAIYILYASSPITLTFAGNGNSVYSNTPFNGFLRMAYVTTQPSPGDPNVLDSAQRIALLDKYAHYVPLGGKVTAAVMGDSTKFSMQYHWTTNSNSDSLLMMALPHHQDMLSNATSHIMKYRSIKGNMAEVYGKTWNMTENLIPNYSWYPSSNLSGVANSNPKWLDSLYKYVKADYDTTIGARYQAPNGTNQPASDPYGFGKTITRMARVIIIADELAERYQAIDPSNPNKNITLSMASIARDTVFNFLKRWVDGQTLVWNPPPPPFTSEKNKLVWDRKYGGIISYLSWIASDHPDPNIYNYDFGNARYNDHAFHYGYYIYAAAVVARKKPQYFSASGNSYMNKILDLCRDIGNPSAQDPYFTPHRHKDWYDGNSFMNGIQCQAAGRDQESVSEAANAYYGMYLFGLAMGNENLKNTGKLMLAQEIRAFKKYYRVFQQSNPNYGSYSQNHIIVGNLWHSLITNTTFGKKPRFIYGVHMLPLNPFIDKMWDKPFAGEVWNKVYTNNQPSSLQKDLTLFTTPFSPFSTGTVTVMTYNMIVQAIANPQAAYNYFQQYKGFTGYFDDGTSKSNAYYWILLKKLNPGSTNTASVKLAIQGYYDETIGMMSKSDTLAAYLRNSFAPYELLDSSLAVIDSSSLTAEFLFSHQKPGEYYAVIDHENAIETWSGTGQFFYAPETVTNFDFTKSQTSAFGDNLILKGDKYCLYNGDLTEDETINLNDVNALFNYIQDFTEASEAADLTGDGEVNLTDLLVTYNNTVMFVGRIAP